MFSGRYDRYCFPSEFEEDPLKQFVLYRLAKTWTTRRSDGTHKRQMRNFCACGDGQVHGVDALSRDQATAGAHGRDPGVRDRTLAGPYQQGSNTSATISGRTQLNSSWPSAPMSRQACPKTGGPLPATFSSVTLSASGQKAFSQAPMVRVRAGPCHRISSPVLR
jgi:hypothetical protein